jgi:hypothetical protein
MSKYKLKVPWEHYQRLQAYTNEVDTEIGGLCRIDLEKDVFTVAEVFLLEQTASKGECELSSKGIDTLYRELLNEDKDVDNLYGWWHSHGTMDAFFSKTDTDTMDEWPGDWIVAICINKNRKVVGRLQVQKPVTLYLDLEVEIEQPTLDNIEEIKKEIKEKVTEETVSIQKWGYQRNKQPWGWNGQDWGKKREKTIHEMDDEEFEELCYYGYGTDQEYDEWAAKFCAAVEKDDEEEQKVLAKYALDKGILDKDELSIFLGTA